jgi:uncharacterized protein YqeY
MGVLGDYLPKLMSEEDIHAALEELLAEAQGNQGKLMGLFNKKYPKKADNLLVKKVVAELLD